MDKFIHGRAGFSGKKTNFNLKNEKCPCRFMMCSNIASARSSIPSVACVNYENIVFMASGCLLRLPLLHYFENDYICCHNV